MSTALVEVGVSTVASAGVATAVGADTLLTALITFGISLITVVGGELIKYLVAYLKKKREDIEGKDKEEETHE